MKNVRQGLLGPDMERSAVMGRCLGWVGFGKERPRRVVEWTGNVIQGGAWFGLRKRPAGQGQGNGADGKAKAGSGVASGGLARIGSERHG